MARWLKWIVILILALWLSMLLLCALLGWLIGRATASPLCPDGRSLIFLMDQSGSMARELDPQGMRWQFAEALISALRKRPQAPSQIALVAYGTRPQVLLPPTVLSGARIPLQAPEMGWSDLIGALEMAMTLSDECAIWILLSDGVPQTAEQRDPEGHFPLLREQLRAGRQQGILIVLVRVAPPTAYTWRAFQKASPFWQQMAEEGTIQLFHLHESHDIPDLVGELLASLSQPSSLMPTPTPHPKIDASPTMPPRPPLEEDSLQIPIPPSSPVAPVRAETHRAKGSLSLLIPGFLGCLLFFSLLRICRARRPRLPGELLLITDPKGLSGRRWDLSRIRRKRLTLGEDLDPALPRSAAQLELRPDERGTTRIHLIPLQPGRVFQEERPLQEPIPLQDGDCFRIDGYLFRYENLKERIERWEPGGLGWPLM
ncbi:MAG: VWA domain-containing protein [Thermoflexus sp.]|nr:VWA domain-containing protein [Thermoflexus sp.]